jgi:hypothetical protein
VREADKRVIAPRIDPISMITRGVFRSTVLVVAARP